MIQKQRMGGAQVVFVLTGGSRFSDPLLAMTREKLQNTGLEIAKYKPLALDRSV
jgi:hypothetical protein